MQKSAIVHHFFENVINQSIDRIRRLLNLNSDFKVLFLQGAPSLQFSMIPMNLILPGSSADYINTGTWSTKAIKEIQILDKPYKVIASSEDRNFCYIPKEYTISEGAAYVHYTSNNTIKGTQWGSVPQAGTSPLVSDMSSDIFSRPFDPSPFGLIYAGAQKNLGPAGVTLVIIREDMLARCPKNIPTMLRYTTHAEKKLPVQHSAMHFHIYGQFGAKVDRRDYRRTGSHGNQKPQESGNAL